MTTIDHTTQLLWMSDPDPPGPSAAAPTRPEPALGFDAFYQAEYGAIVAAATALTGDRGRAEELTQDAFLTACRRWKVVGGYDRPGAWVRRVVINRAIDRRRRVVREAAAMLRLRPATRATAIDGPATGLDPDHELWAAVRALPRRQAQVVVLTYVEDLTTAEIAAVLGIDAGTVRSHLATGRAALATLLDTRNDAS